MNRDRRRRAGLVGVVGGAGLLVYVALKELWIPTVGGMHAFDARAGFSFHFFEVLPMVFLTAGVYGLYASQRERGSPLADAALGIAFVGTATATAGHGIEHTLFYFESPVGYVFTATHYLGLGLAALGFTVAGLRARPSRVLGERERMVLASTLPVALVASALLGTLLFRSYADGFKVPVALVVVVVGYRLWRPHSGVGAVGGTTVSDAAP